MAPSRSHPQRQARAVAPEASQPYALRDVSTLPRVRKQRNAPHVPPSARHGPGVVGPFGMRLVQAPNLRPPAGYEGLRQWDLFKPHNSVSTPPPLVPLYEPPPVDSEADLFAPSNWEPVPSPQRTRRRYHQSKAAQYQQWHANVIPSLIPWYLELQHVTHSGQKPVPLAPPWPPCNCSHKHTLEIDSVYWDRIEQVYLMTCPCFPAPTQLLRRGLFGCAPCRPTLAVDTNLLEFIIRLFVYTAPNITGWARAHEQFLAARGYVLQGKDPLRRRLGTCLLWYQRLQQSCVSLVETWVEQARHNVLADLPNSTLSPSSESQLPSPSSPPFQPLHPSSPSFQPDLPASPSFHPPHPSSFLQPDLPSSPFQPPSPSSPFQSGRPSSLSLQPPPSPLSQPPSLPSLGAWTPPLVHCPARNDTITSRLVRPSEYLRSRCALCFGGGKPQLLNSPADVLACIDACFSQKRRATPREPAFHHPKSFFLTEEECDNMAAIVESLHSKPTRGREKTARVPNEILDECEKVFVAAQQFVAKASKAFFSDTALMALLCRHDNVLWLANVTTPGERQFYALALIRKLFDNLPPMWHVGILYDIGCQIDRSLAKFNFLGDDIRQRITFAISVFHAYGHQWACQLAYHPRKCCGFGLTDGEGCERCWSSLRRLIPSLRVSGYHRRLFVIDSHITYLQVHERAELATWLQRKLRACQRRKEESLEALRECGISVNDLRAQWTAQKAAQLKPLPRQSKHAGESAIKDIKRKHAEVSTLKEDITHLEQRLHNANSQHDSHLMALLQEDLKQAFTTLEHSKSQLQQAELSLGLNESSDLQGLNSNAFIRARANARAVKERLRNRLVMRKFEMAKLERSYREQIMDNKEHVHTKASIHRRENGISHLAHKFNKICSDMEHLIENGQAPDGALVPPRIKLKGLFRLDIEDGIWVDIGLDDGNDPLPAWLVDDEVRSGIVAMLQLDRCQEEHERLVTELQAVAAWMSEEWNVIQQALIMSRGHPVIQYQLELQAKCLRSISANWQCHAELLQTMPNFSSIPVPPPIPRLSCSDRGSEKSIDDIKSDSSLGDEEDIAGEVIELFEALQPAVDFEDNNFGSDAQSDVQDLPSLPSSPCRPVDLSLPPLQSRTSQPMPTPPVITQPFASPHSRQNAITVHIERPSHPQVESEVGPAKDYRVAGLYRCTSAEIQDLANDPKWWFTGTLISIIAEANHLRLICLPCEDPTSIPLSDHLPSEVLLDVSELMEAEKSGDLEIIQKKTQAILRPLRRVRPPYSCRSWLMPVCHKFHWVLIEIAWHEKECRLYDSLSQRGSYRSDTDYILSLLSRFFALIIAEYQLPINGSEWKTVDELRPARQHNNYDCGAYVLSDLLSLANSGRPGELREEYVQGYRRFVADCVRALPRRIKNRYFSPSADMHVVE